MCGTLAHNPAAHPLQVGNDFTELAEPPSTLLMPLLPYQKQFLAWALKQVRTCSVCCACCVCARSWL